MPVFVDLINQVQKILPVRFGGTGNDQGYATERLILPYMNDEDHALPIGTLVHLLGIHNDRRVKESTEMREQAVVGVVVGRFSTAAGTLHQFEAVAPDTNDTVAVCISGRCSVLISSAVTIKQFGYASATDGQAYGLDYIDSGAIGQFESTNASGSALIRLFGGPSTPGMVGSIVAVLGDGATLLQVGTKGDVVVPFNLTLQSWTMLSTASGSCVIDIYYNTYADFPPAGSDSITGPAPPTISSGIKAQDLDLTGWTVDLDAGSTLRFEVESASSLSQVTVQLAFIRR